MFEVPFEISSVSVFETPAIDHSATPSAAFISIGNPEHRAVYASEDVRGRDARLGICCDVRGAEAQVWD